ncbi:MAG: response regulator transcription factor, partial [Pseudomonadota bacterium]
MRIALLEDDPDQGALLKAWLEEDRHLCHHFKSAEDLKRALNRESFDLLLLDWLLPESSGIEVLQWVRNRVDWRIPVIFITRKDTDEDVVYALEQGADDYIAKPVSRPVALARVHAIERRVFREKGGRETLESGNIGIDVATGSVTKDGVPVTLTDREAKLAAVL